MHVEIRTIKDGKDNLAGVLRLVDGEVVAEPADSRRLQSMLESPVYDFPARKAYFAEDSPKEFLEALHKQYTSAYLRASKPIDDDEYAVPEIKAWDKMRKNAGHDVSGEPRDEAGKWTTGGAATQKPEKTEGENMAAEKPAVSYQQALADAGISRPGSGYKPPGYETITLRDVWHHLKTLIYEDDEASPSLDPASDYDAPIVKVTDQGKTYIIDGSHRLYGMVRWAKENGKSLDEVNVIVALTDDRSLFTRATQDNEMEDKEDFDNAVDEIYRRANKAEELKEQYKDNGA